MNAMFDTIDFREAAAEEIRFAFATFSLGTVLVAASDKGVAAILMGDDQTALTRELTSAFPGARLAADQAGLEDTIAKVAAFLDAPHKGLELPLDIRGNALEQAIWQALRAVPSGETITYGEESYARTVAIDSAMWKPLDGQNSVSSVRAVWLESNPKRAVLRLVGLAKNMAKAGPRPGRAKHAGVPSGAMLA